jgi:hypothetical protein
MVCQQVLREQLATKNLRMNKNKKKKPSKREEDEADYAKWSVFS